MKKKTLDKNTDAVLIAFCLHEGLMYPTVKSIFLRQTPEEQKQVLEDMKRTIKLKYNNQKAYAQFIKKATNEAKNEASGSSRKRLN